MSGALHQAATDYLKVRRALGSRLDGYDRLLASLVAYLEAAGAATVTTELAVCWARLPGDGAHPAYLGKRLCVARGFARHLQAFDPAAEVPPARLLPHRKCRAVPYLYSPEEIAALMDAAGSLAPRLRAATYQTLIGLVSVTGMRISEAIQLGRDDLDRDEGVLTVWHSKFGKSRELPLHPSVAGSLAAYASLRDRLCLLPGAGSFFVSPAGTRLVYVTVQRTFSGLVRLAGIKARPERCRPRLHDLRHSFACRVVLGWYRADVDVEAHLPRLSAYLGHAGPSGTYWYLSAVPELLELAANRREQARGAQP
jgi:integrase